MKQQLFSIDQQVDFCDPAGALYVKGADEDAKRLAKFVEKMGDQIDSISATLDSHRLIQIFHTIYWVDNHGNHPKPFTIINEGDVTGKSPQWKAYNPAWQTRSVQYVQDLAKRGRNPLVIWPNHTLIGHKGHNVYPVVFDAFQAWENKYFGMVDYCVKGSNPFSEMYSIFEADVPDPEDPTTQLNTGLVRKLQQADTIWINGQALSHCVNWSIRDCAREFGDEHVKKFVLLEDCSSAVSDLPGSTMFQDMATNFVKEMKALGMRVAKTTDF